MKYEVISQFNYDKKTYNVGDTFPKEKVTEDLKSKLKCIYDNQYQVPIKDGCTGEMYYYNSKTGERKEDNTDNNPDFKLIDKAWKPKHALCSSLICDKDKKPLYFIHETDDNLQYSDCIKITKETKKIMEV